MKTAVLIAILATAQPAISQGTTGSRPEFVKKDRSLEANLQPQGESQTGSAIEAADSQELEIDGHADLSSTEGDADSPEALGFPVLVSSFPPCDSSLWRTQNNFIDLTFDTPIIAPTHGEVQVVEILRDGAFGEDVTGQFSFSVLEDGMTLRAQQNGFVGRSQDSTSGILKHRKWYVVRNLNWASTLAFTRSYVVQVGDANGNGSITGQDWSSVLGSIPCFDVQSHCPSAIRADINADNRVTSLDISSLNAIGSSFRVFKPIGHDCRP